MNSWEGTFKEEDFKFEFKLKKALFEFKVVILQYIIVFIQESRTQVFLTKCSKDTFKKIMLHSNS